MSFDDERVNVDAIDLINSITNTSIIKINPSPSHSYHDDDYHDHFDHDDNLQVLELYPEFAESFANNLQVTFSMRDVSMMIMIKRSRDLG